MSFTRGFTSGFGLIDGVMRQNRAEERQANLDEIDQERYANQQNMSQEQLNIAKGQFALSQKQHEQNAANAEATRKMEREKLGLMKQESNQNQALNQLKIDREKVEMQNAYNQQAHGFLKMAYAGQDIGEEGRQVVNKSVYRGMWNDFSGNVEDVQNHFAKYGEIKNPQQLVQYLNDPKTLKYAKSIFSNEVYAREKATGLNYDIVGLEPMPGGKVLPKFRITDAKGVVIKDDVPATQGKSGEPGDVLAPVSLQDMKSKAVEAINFVSYVKANPTLQKTLGFTPKTDPLKLGKDERLIDKNTGETIVGSLPDSGEGIKPKQALDAARNLLKVSVDAMGMAKYAKPSELPPEDQRRYYELIQASGLTLSEAENAIRQGAVKPKPPKKSPVNGDPVGDYFSRK